MSNDDRDVPEFDDFDLPDELPQPGDEAARPTDGGTEPTEAMVPPAEETIRPAEDTAPDGPPAGEAPAGDLAVPLSAGPERDVPDAAPAESSEEDRAGQKKESLLWKLRNASPYTVMLGISLAAILIAILCLWMELRTYNGDIKAEEAKQRVSAVPAVQFGSPRTTAAA